MMNTIFHKKSLVTDINLFFVCKIGKDLKRCHRMEILTRFQISFFTFPISTYSACG